MLPTGELQKFLEAANTALAEDRWHHPRGDFCFFLDASQPVPPAPYFY